MMIHEVFIEEVRLVSATNSTTHKLIKCWPEMNHTSIKS